MSKPLHWANKSLILVLAVPLLMLPALLQVCLAPVALMPINALFVRVVDLILTGVLALTGIEGRAFRLCAWRILFPFVDLAWGTLGSS